MHVLRILLLVMTAGVLAFILYQAITRQISREFWTVIAIACGFSLNLIYLWFAKPGEPPVAIEDKPPVAVEKKHPWSIRQTMLVRNPMRSAASGA